MTSHFQILANFISLRILKNWLIRSPTLRVNLIAENVTNFFIHPRVYILDFFKLTVLNLRLGARTELFFKLVSYLRWATSFRSGLMKRLLRRINSFDEMSFKSNWRVNPWLQLLQARLILKIRIFEKKSPFDHHLWRAS